MQSQISICNRALAHMGQTRFIRALDESSQEAETLRFHYDPVRRALLADHVWRFATMLSPLPELTVSVPGWRHVYAMPSGCLRVVSVMPAADPADWNTEFETTRLPSGRAILANEPNALCRYVFDVSDPLEFPPLFADALSWRLALEISTPLTTKQGLRDHLASHYMEALRRAVDADVAEASCPLPEWGDEYIKARS